MRVFASLIVGAALCVVGCDRNSESSSSGDGGDGARVVLEVRPPVENAELYIATQAELAKGDAVLEAAAEALGLAAKWDVEDAGAAAAKLAPMVTSARVGDSALIELVVAAGDETESAEIANAVAKAFAEWAADEEQARVAKRREALQQKIEAQKEKLEKARVKMLDAIEEYNVTENGKPLVGGGAAMEDLRSTIAALQKFEGDELIEAAVNLGLNGEVLPQRYPEYQNTKLQRDQLRQSGLGSKHPKVVATERQLTQLEGLLLEAVAVAKSTLKTQLEMAEQAIATRELREREAVVNRSQGKLEFQETKEDYEREKKRLEALGETEVGVPEEPPAVVR